MKQWEDFKGDRWRTSADARDFIQNNYTEYKDDDSFLEPIVPSTNKLWAKLRELFEIKHEKDGVYGIDSDVPATITSHEPGYLVKGEGRIIGLQADAPLKQVFMPLDGIKVVSNALVLNGYGTNEETIKIFTEYRKTHDQGIFDTYTARMYLARRNKIITGLPDTYGRGRAIGDYRRITLYGADYLMEQKGEDHDNTGNREMTDDATHLHEEASEQYRALSDLKQMAASYGFSTSRPATSAQEAIRWLYSSYLGVIRSQNDMAVPIGRISAFLDVYVQYSLKTGLITEFGAQEMIDHLVMKLRMVEFARTPEYDQLFSGYPIRVALSIAGIGINNRSLVTRNDFRILHTLTDIGLSPEPNLTVLYSSRSPKGPRAHVAKVTKESLSTQFESDDLLCENWGSSGCAIVCCASTVIMDGGIQFFDARASLMKAVFCTINGGVDEKTKMQVAPKYRPMTGDKLDYHEFMEHYKDILDWLIGLYVNTLSIVHYIHGKYAYEAPQSVLMDTDLQRTFTTGIAGIPRTTDSIMVIKHGEVEVTRDEDGITIDHVPAKEFPVYRNGSEEADVMAN